MLFNSFQFLVFFPIVLVGYFCLAGRWRTYWLLASSYYFYMSWRPEYAALLALTTVTDYSMARLIGRVERVGQRRAYLLTSLVVNLGILFTYKYLGLFSQAVQSLGRVLHAEWNLPALDVLLPVGISFYTFQSLSYTVDVYRRTLKPEPNILRYALYVSFFPQLVAGPIERATHLLPQLPGDARFECARVTNGLKLMVWGLFKKMVIADRLGIIVQHVYGTPSEYVGPQLVLATVFFAFQIYCDFSGYSDVAVGIAQVMGVNIMTNFDRPYAAKSVAEFWRRWHISLSTWFRDYVYVPLGGNRVPLWRWYVNILLVFMMSGVWHGASYTYIAWGALHGGYMVFGRMSYPVRVLCASFFCLTCFPLLHAALQRIMVFALVSFAWIFFRASDLSQACYIVQHLDNGWRSWMTLPGIKAGIEGMGVSLGDFYWAVGLIILLEVVSWMESGERMREFMMTRPLVFRWAILICFLLLICNFSITQQIPFIYFQF